MKASLSYRSLYNLFFLFVSIVWSPIQIYYLHIDGAARTLAFMEIVAVMLNVGAVKSNKDVFRSSAFICWTILCIFTFINSIIHGLPLQYTQYGAWAFFRQNIISPFIFLCVSIIELKNNKYKCLNVVLLAQMIFLIIGAIHTNTTLSQFDRGLNEELGNMLPLTAVSSVFVAGVLFSERKLKLGWFAIGLIIVFAVYLIIVSVTRKAFGAVIIIVVGIMLGRSRKLNVRTGIMNIIIGIILYIGVQYTLNHTYMGERIVESTDSVDVPLSSNPTVNNILMSVLGDRAEHYYLGRELFYQHPVLGIGLLNFSSVASSSHRLHTEYMVQLCENGIIGFSLLVLYYFVLLKGLLQKRKEKINIWIYLSGLLYVLFINLTAWTFDMKYIMITYAIVITRIYSKPGYYEDSNSQSQR